MNIKICSKCKKELPLTEYYSRGNGRLRSECKNCHKQYVTLKYKERKDTVNQIKATYKCAKCGEGRFYMLDFHHIDPNIKDENIARLTSNRNKIEDIKKEIEKCVVLCSNCHREFHYLNENQNINLEEYLEDTITFESSTIFISNN